MRKVRTVTPLNQQKFHKFHLRCFEIKSFIFYFMSKEKKTQHTKKIKVFVAFEIPATILQALTNGSTKIWITDKAQWP